MYIDLQVRTRTLTYTHAYTRTHTNRTPPPLSTHIHIYSRLSHHNVTNMLVITCKNTQAGETMGFDPDVKAGVLLPACCNGLQCVTVYYIVLWQCVAVCCETLQCVAVCCSGIAVCCYSLLQCVAVCYSPWLTTQCNPLQHTWQHTATHRRDKCGRQEKHPCAHIRLVYRCECFITSDIYIYIYICMCIYIYM